MSKHWLIIFSACLFLSAGCNIIYKQNIQQGNALEQKDLNQLELGMTRNQVHFLLGTPAVQDPFHHDRWDYVSSFSRRGGDPIRRLVTLEFEDDRLTRMTGVTDGTGEEVLGEDGAVAVAPSVYVPGVNVNDAREYEDLSLVSTDNPNWSIQAGSFSTRAEADERLKTLTDQGIDATIYGQVIGNIGFFVVRTGSYSSKEQAASARARLESQTGLTMFLVTPGS